MQDAHYSETSPNNTALINLIVQSRDTTPCFLDFNPKTSKLFTFFSLYKIKLVLQV